MILQEILRVEDAEHHARIGRLALGKCATLSKWNEANAANVESVWYRIELRSCVSHSRISVTKLLMDRN